MADEVEEQETATRKRVSAARTHDEWFEAMMLDQREHGIEHKSSDRTLFRAWTRCAWNDQQKEIERLRRGIQMTIEGLSSGPHQQCAAPAIADLRVLLAGGGA